MEIVFLNNNREEWDTFASKSDDAWFWHTTESMEYVQELSKESCIANYSFSIVENSETVAVCPVIVERNALAKDIKQFSMHVFQEASEYGFCSSYCETINYL